MTIRPLPPSFFEQETVHVAQALLGHSVVRRGMIFRIVETEAYTQDDPACHGFKGNKGRGATIYKSPGLAYVYLIYGMYHCLNVVTEPEGRAGAVLIRALEPLSGESLKTHGPGRLCKALGITKLEHNELVLTQANSELFLAEGEPVPDSHIVTTARIGISKAQEYPWRFYIRDNPWVSVL